MKLLFFNGHAHMALDPNADRASGGAELQVALLARELAHWGIAVTILGADTGQPDGVSWQGVRIRTGGRFDTGGLMPTLAALPRVVKVLREERPDAVCVYGWTAWLYLLARLKGAMGFRLVFVCALDSEIDGTFRRNNPLRGAMFERGVALADIRFGITDHHAGLFAKRALSCGVTRLQLRDPAHRPDVEKRVDFLWVARCTAVKNPGVFLELAAELPAAKFRMVCSPQDMKLWNRIRQRADDLANVEFLDRVPYGEIQRHFDQARIFVNTSDDEGMPNTFLHAGQGGAAILSLRVDPDGMFTRHGAGICANGDSDCFKRHARSLFDSPEEWQRARAGAARFIESFHDNRRNADAFLKGIGGCP